MCARIVALASLVSLPALASLAAAADENVTVVRKTLAMEQEHELQVDRTLEYVLQFAPDAEQSRYPARLWVRAAGAGDAARPLLLTARQHTGAITWQLPYYSGDTLLHELQRTLCPPDSAALTSGAALAGGADADDCADEEESRRGEWTLHVSSSCSGTTQVRLRVEPARDWLLYGQLPLPAIATLARPLVARFQYAAEQTSVRLVVSSPDDVCATVAVQPYSCPIAQTLDELGGSMVRMTVESSGGAQLAKSLFPHGFYVTTVVHATDEACSGEAAPAAAAAGWLWDAALGGGEAARELPPAREKQITLQMKEALSRAEYLVAAVATLALFLSFYVAFGALVALQRWPRWRRLVGPRAVLADPARTETGAASPAAGARRRRDSAATFDSSDNSEEEEDEISVSAAATHGGAPGAGAEAPGGAPGAVQVREGGLAANGSTVATDTQHDSVTGNGHTTDEQAGAAAGQAGAARPFGLPAQLNVAALARRRERVLRARSQRYLYTLATVAVFYALPALQLVTAFQLILNTSGSLDLCYYNFLCAHPAGVLSDFNHVWSNVGYLLLGALFMLQLRRRRLRRDRRPRDQEYGIPAHYGLLSSLGAGMMVVALLSASYHVCPNQLNFQFDTAFMYVLAVLCMVKIYQSRHPDINARAHATFGVLAVLIALVVWGVLGGGPLFWSLFTVLHVFTFLLLSLRIYYVGQFRLGKASLAEAARGLRSPPLYRARLAALLVANAVNWAWALYGLATQTANIASHLLFVLLCNALLYILFYLGMKLLHGERPRWYVWLWLGGAALCWAPALYMFLAGSSDWALPAARSRAANHECRVLRFYDSHDMWHVLSAVALYLTFNVLLTWDDGLAAVKRTDIAVF